MSTQEHEKTLFRATFCESVTRRTSYVVRKIVITFSDEPLNIFQIWKRQSIEDLKPMKPLVFGSIRSTPWWVVLHSVRMSHNSIQISSKLLNTITRHLLKIFMIRQVLSVEDLKSYKYWNFEWYRLILREFPLACSENVAFSHIFWK